MSLIGHFELKPSMFTCNQSERYCILFWRDLWLVGNGMCMTWSQAVL